MEGPEMGFTPDNLRRAGLILTSAALLGLAACSNGEAGPAQSGVTIEQPAPITHSEQATQGWPEAVLKNTGNPELHKLADYGDILQQRLPDSLMTFTGMPRTPEEAATTAASMATTLKEYHAAGVSPLVIMEPSSYGDGSILDLTLMSRGGFDMALAAYYQGLKNNGITDTMMGTWTVLPEANTPAWNITDPRVVRDSIVHVAQVQKAVFPDSQVSVMLDSETYDNNDQDWATGRYASLLPYVDGIPRGLIDSFGLQGFPWADEGAPATSIDTNAPNQFLSVQMATQAAQALGVRKIWFNTGTFASMHDNTPGKVVASAPQRREMLQVISEQARVAKAEGFAVTMNVFAADKANTSEAVDWSYLRSAADSKVLADFAASERAGGVHISLFDSANP